MLCTVCTDYKRFRLKVDDARRIRTNIERLMPSTPVDTSVTNGNELRAYFTETQNVHFKCGHCMKANKNELLMEEAKITQLILTFFAYVKTSKPSEVDTYTDMYYVILRNLRGDYPKTAHNVEQYWFKCVKELKEGKDPEN